MRIGHAVTNHSVDVGIVGQVRIGIGPETLCDESELEEDLPLVGLIVVERKHGLAVVRHVTNRESVERDVVVIALQLRRWRKDHIGMSSRLVEVDVDTHHEIESVESAIELIGVRCGENGIPSDRDESTNTFVTGLGDLLGQIGHRILPHHLGVAAHDGAPTPAPDTKSRTRTLLATSGRATGHRPGEHRATT